MTDQLPVAAGGGAVAVPSGGDIALADQGGDITANGAPLPVVQSPTGPMDKMWNDFAHQTQLEPEALQRVLKWLARPKVRAIAERELEERYIVKRVEQDLTQSAATEAALRGEWAGAYEANIDRIRGWLDAQGPEFAETISQARDASCDPICNSIPFLRALLAAASRPASRTAAAASSEPGREDAARVREIERWMGAPRGSEDYKRYWNDLEVQEEYRKLVGQQQSRS